MQILFYGLSRARTILFLLNVIGQKLKFCSINHRAFGCRSCKQLLKDCRCILSDTIHQKREKQVILGTGGFRNDLNDS